MKIALLITGDEILKGDLRDSNSYYLIHKFTELGHPVSQVVILGDDLHALSAKVKNLAKDFDILIINGGLGPTIELYLASSLYGYGLFFSGKQRSKSAEKGPCQSQAGLFAKKRNAYFE